MVVKSATKKRLMEMGIAEEYAHKLATDRNMNDIKSLTADEIASVLGVSKDDEIFTGAMNALAELGNRRQKRRSRKITISKKALDDDDFNFSSIKFNVLNHHLVPHQELVEPEDEESELEPWGLMIVDDETGETRLAKELLPKILITDPVIQVIKETVELEVNKNSEDEDHVPLPAGWLSDRILKVVRKSPSAGVSVAYRLIVEGS
ncbi:MAG: DNA-directed RNA polymerase subunit RpoH/Rpb5 C-terminal domain-containing protein [Candidatus Poseidoniaceae archaeon]|jgi:DNA-directed RNA polymerase subunit H (RpoH/RPB5)|nr:DNA-directed RNA polymerase subunit RpoH/Rpb5 C-terminal domain-containing protein [Candidatus Poseidoniaceae archaeon]